VSRMAGGSIRATALSCTAAAAPWLSTQQDCSFSPPDVGTLKETLPHCTASHQRKQLLHVVLLLSRDDHKMNSHGQLLSSGKRLRVGRWATSKVNMISNTGI